MKHRPSNPRLTRREKDAILSIARNGYIAWGGGGGPMPPNMIARLARKGLVKRDRDGTPLRHLTRFGRAVVEQFSGRESKRLGYRFRQAWANPKFMRSHIARTLSHDQFGLLRWSDAIDPEMRP